MPKIFSTIRYKWRTSKQPYLTYLYNSKDVPTCPLRNTLVLAYKYKTIIIFIYCIENPSDSMAYSRNFH